MTEAALAVAGKRKPSSTEVRKVAGAAVAYALVLAAFDIFVGSGTGGVVSLAIVAVLVGVAAAAVFLWAVPWAFTLEEPGASVAALVSSGLGLLTVVIFWSGLTPVFAAAGILLGRSERNAWGGRFYARAAIAIGVAALVLDVIAVLVDVF